MSNKTSNMYSNTTTDMTKDTTTNTATDMLIDMIKHAVANTTKDITTNTATNTNTATPTNTNMTKDTATVTTTARGMVKDDTFPYTYFDPHNLFKEREIPDVLSDSDVLMDETNILKYHLGMDPRKYDANTDTPFINSYRLIEEYDAKFLEENLKSSKKRIAITDELVDSLYEEDYKLFLQEQKEQLDQYKLNRKKEIKTLLKQIRKHIYKIGAIIHSNFKNKLNKRDINLLNKVFNVIEVNDRGSATYYSLNLYVLYTDKGLEYDKKLRDIQLDCYRKTGMLINGRNVTTGI